MQALPDSPNHRLKQWNQAGQAALAETKKKCHFAMVAAAIPANPKPAVYPAPLSVAKF